MKTTYIYIVLTLVLCFSLQAQTKSTSDSNEAFKGIEKTLSMFVNDLINNSYGLKEYRRLVKLTQSDIRLMMFGSKKKETINYLNTQNTEYSKEGFYFQKLESQDYLYVQFDWDNGALVMIGEPSKSYDEFGYFGKWTNNGYEDEERIPISVNKKDKIVQFTDKDGFWYVPMKLGSGNTIFIKFNAKQSFQKISKDLFAITLQDYATRIGEMLVYIGSVIDWQRLDALNPGYIAGLKLIEIQNQTKEGLEALLKERYRNLEGFPIFIHWALLYSPESIKRYYGNKVSETTFDCDGFSNACTKLTITSGKENGKLMLFDRYGRLVFIDTKGEGTALFQYGRDITVNLPPAYTMQDIMSGKVVIPD